MPGAPARNTPFTAAAPPITAAAGLGLVAAAPIAAAAAPVAAGAGPGLAAAALPPDLALEEEDDDLDDEAAAKARSCTSMGYNAVSVALLEDGLGAHFPAYLNHHHLATPDMGRWTAAQQAHTAVHPRSSYALEWVLQL